ncbi:MAG: ATP-binding protein, partial [Lachnospiraceae bacterium]|nr:ATP-binding protein [Lachnospiraceae bacterium]
SPDAPGRWCEESYINEFIRTKAAAYTMMEYLLSETGIGMDEVDDSHYENSMAECASQPEGASKWADTVKDFYMAGAFGSHVDKESAINIGMYPDVAPERIHTEGNTSLEGARRLLLDQSILEELPQILDRMTYVQFGAVEDFLEKMVAASALPHTDLERYPSVKARLQACSACVPGDGYPDNKIG